MNHQRNIFSTSCSCNFLNFVRIRLFIGVLIICLFHFYGYNQDIQTNPIIANVIEDFLENTEIEDFDFNTVFENLNYFYQHPIDINNTSEQQLRDLIIINEIQIADFLNHKREFGNFLSIYELQSIESWNLPFIRNVLPFLTIDSEGANINAFNWKEFLKEGNSQLFLKAKRVLEERRGYIPNIEGISPYLGDPNSLYMRYRYQAGQYFRIGFTAEKDPGEEFFKGINPYGFDFYSFFINGNNLNKTIKTLSIGDYIISMGQGLILHNDFGGRKSSFVLNVKKSNRMIRPYSSVNETNFYRGIATELKLSKYLSLGVFGSRKPVNTRVNTDTLDSNDFEFFSSIIQSGFHRTLSEINNKHTTTQTNLGGSLKLGFRDFKISGNLLYTNFNRPFIRDPQLYRKFVFSGTDLVNASIDYSTRYRNFTFFGETALSDNLKMANVHGMLVGLDRKLDLAFIYRNYSPEYQVLDGNAFADGTLPINEKGLYLGLDIRPIKNFTISTYVDSWKNPWVSFRRNGPSFGNDYFIKVAYSIRRKLDFYTQYRYLNKQFNSSGGENVINYPETFALQRLRFQFNYKLTKEWELRNRVEFSFYEKTTTSNGFLMYQDVLFKPIASKLSLSARYAIFDIQSFDARIYTYENDLLFEFYIPFFQNRGSRMYLNLRYKASRLITFELRYGRTYFTEAGLIGSGNERIEGNTRSEIKTQLKFNF